jgi:hypothetical protein
MRYASNKISCISSTNDAEYTTAQQRDIIDKDATIGRTLKNTSVAWTGRARLVAFAISSFAVASSCGGVYDRPLYDVSLVTTVNKTTPITSVQQHV